MTFARLRKCACGTLFRVEGGIRRYMNRGWLGRLKETVEVASPPEWRCPACREKPEEPKATHERRLPRLEWIGVRGEVNLGHRFEDD